MARIATNHAIDYKRKKARESEELSLCKEAEENIQSSHNIEALLLTKEQKLLIAQKLRELPENYRDVVLAHYLEEKSYQEIALQEKHRSKTVEMKLYRARKWIKKTLEGGRVSMMHYSKEDWRNYTLDFIESNERESMEEHLYECIIV